MAVVEYVCSVGYQLLGLGELHEVRWFVALLFTGSAAEVVRAIPSLRVTAYGRTEDYSDDCSSGGGGVGDKLVHGFLLGT